MNASYNKLISSNKLKLNCAATFKQLESNPLFWLKIDAL